MVETGRADFECQHIGVPRPSWYTAVLGAKTFLEAMVNARYACGRSGEKFRQDGAELDRLLERMSIIAALMIDNPLSEAPCQRSGSIAQSKMPSSIDSRQLLQGPG
jgi:hypothetical protein